MNQLFLKRNSVQLKAVEVEYIDNAIGRMVELFLKEVFRNRNQLELNS